MSPVAKPADVLEERKRWLYTRETNPHSKWERGERGSSVVQTRCFISHSRCVDYLFFNWIFVGARQRQRPIVVTVERKRDGAGDEQRKGGAFQSFYVRAPGNTNPITGETEHEDVLNTCTQTNTRVWTCSLAVSVHCRILAVSVFEWRGGRLGLFFRPSGPSYLQEAIYQD